VKVFISHSSKNADYGLALVKLLTGIGIDHDRIVFTSDTSYGIPAGENIFDWLKSCISEKPFVIYLLSPEYYSSVACLNEMGAAWIIENQHRMIFTPDFDLNSDNFKNGALNPREMGFFLGDEDRVTEFIEAMKKLFDIKTKQVVINKTQREFLETVTRISGTVKDVDAIIGKQKSTAKIEPIKVVASSGIPNPENVKLTKPTQKIRKTPTEKYFQDLVDGKVIDEEVLIVYYAAETARHKLGLRWQADEEVERIKGWEDLNDLGNTLSNGYKKAMSRLDLRKLTEVSDHTAYGNPKEVTFVDEMQERLLDLPEEFYSKCDEILAQARAKKKIAESDDILF
jgi:hypothetical protein